MLVLSLYPEARSSAPQSGGFPLTAKPEQDVPGALGPRKPPVLPLSPLLAPKQP